MDPFRNSQVLWFLYQIPPIWSYWIGWLLPGGFPQKYWGIPPIWSYWIPDKFWAYWWESIFCMEPNPWLESVFWMERNSWWESVFQWNPILGENRFISMEPNFWSESIFWMDAILYGFVQKFTSSVISVSNCYLEWASWVTWIIWVEWVSWVGLIIRMKWVSCV